MKPDTALEKRNQLIKDGYCVVEDVLSEDFLDELRRETNRLLDSVAHPPQWKYQGSNLSVRGTAEPVIDRLIHWEPTWKVLNAMQPGDFYSHGGYIILSKPPGAPPLYWHQDWIRWNDPISTAPWVQYIFLSYYLVDTSLENGCFRVIPGTHLKRIPLHDRLTPAHEQGAYYVSESDRHMFYDHPDAIDVPANAGSLVIGEGRVLHAARANRSNQRRTLLLGWHDRPCTVPKYWTDEVPEVILQRDPEAEYERTRLPGKYLA